MGSMDGMFPRARKKRRSPLVHALVVAAVLVSRPCLLEAQHLRAAGLMAYIPRNSLTKSNRAWDLGDKKPTEVEHMHKYQADSGFYSPLMLPVSFGHMTHTKFTLPRSNPRDWGLDTNLASMYQTWPDIAGTDYAMRMPSGFYHKEKRFNIDKPEALPPWQMQKEILAAHNPPPYSNLDPMIPSDYMGEWVSPVRSV